MKRKNFLWSLAALLVTAAMSMGFASCSDDDDDDNPLVGTWTANSRIDDMFIHLTVQFKAKGTYIVTQERLLITKAVKTGKWRYYGEYQVDGNKLTTQDDDTCERYDEETGKWIKETNPNSIKTSTKLFSVETDKLYFYYIEDTEMMYPQMIYTRE